MDAGAEGELEPEEEAEPEAWEEPLEETGVELEVVEAAGQLRSYKGVVLNVVPTIPKLGFGVVGYASCRVNQKVLTLPKSLPQPTSSQ